MSRTIPSALVTALSQEVKQPYFAFEALLDAGALRLWTGRGDRQIDGQTYTGAGRLIGMGDVDETIELTAEVVTVTLSGVPSSVLSVALSEPYQGRRATIYLGERSVAEVMIAFAGVLDTMTPVDNGDLCTLQVTLESKLVDLQRPRLRRYTKESQRALWAGDSFFDWTASLADAERAFGRDNE